MKYLSILIVFSVMVFTGSAKAQSASKFNGKSYTYVMKLIDGSSDEEIIDKITISDNTISSEKYSASGFKSGKMSEKVLEGNGSQIAVTLKSDSKGTMVYDLALNETSISGTVTVTDAGGAQTIMAIRGMPTEQWNDIQKAKKEYKEKQK